MVKIIKSKYKFCGNCNEPASQFFYVIAGFGKGKPLCLSCVMKLEQACAEAINTEWRDSHNYYDESQEQVER